VTDIWGYILVGLFTLVGAIVGGIVPHILHQRSLSKQRKWALEDEARKTKRELVNKRLGNVEEVIGLMVIVIDDAVGEAIDLQSRANNKTIEEAKNRIAMKNSDCWAAVLLTGSDELQESYRVISQMYSDLLELDNIPENQEAWDKVRDAQIAAIEIIDNMRAFR